MSHFGCYLVDEFCESIASVFDDVVKGSKQRSQLTTCATACCKQRSSKNSYRLNELFIQINYFIFLFFVITFACNLKLKFLKIFFFCLLVIFVRRWSRKERRVNVNSPEISRWGLRGGRENYWNKQQSFSDLIFFVLLCFFRCWLLLLMLCCC